MSTPVTPEAESSSNSSSIARFLKGDGLTVLVVVALIVVYAALRTPGDSFASMDDLSAALYSGKPTVIELFSNTCGICLSSKPTVDRMERELQGQAAVLRINVKDAVGRYLAGQWGVQGVPTFVVVSQDSAIVYARAGAPDVEAIKAAVSALIP